MDLERVFYRMYILVLKETINIFCDNGSYTFANFTDLSKAFDAVNFWNFFKELKDKSVASNVVNFIAYLYNNDKLRKTSISERFSRSSGTKTGITSFTLLTYKLH